MVLATSSCRARARAEKRRARRERVVRVVRALPSAGLQVGPRHPALHRRADGGGAGAEQEGDGAKSAKRGVSP